METAAEHAHNLCNFCFKMKEKIVTLAQITEWKIWSRALSRFTLHIVNTEFVWSLNALKTALPVNLSQFQFCLQCRLLL